MLEQAAHLVDAVVLAVPLRHDALSFPIELSLLAATNPKGLRAVARINYEVTARYFRHRAAESSTVGRTTVGAITYRFWSSPQLHLHLHVCVFDGVFDGVFVERDSEAQQFSTARALSTDKLRELLESDALRVGKWLCKHGLAWDDQKSVPNETRVFTFDEMLAQVAAGRGTVEKANNCHDNTPASSTETNPRPPPCDGVVTFCGFSLHTSVPIATDNDLGIERIH